MPPPKPFKPVETPDLVYKEGVKGPARPLAAPISPSVTAPMPAVMSVPDPAPAPQETQKTATVRGQSAQAIATLPATTAGSQSTQVARPAKYDRKQLQLDSKELTGRMTRWLLEGDRLETMLAETKFRDITVALGIMTDKMLLLEGQPTQIIGQPQQQKLDQLGQALQTMMQQRGLGKTVTLTERTATVNLEGK